MKELSVEEKARRYDEAKLRMSAAYNSNRCTIGFMNEIFPELKESEDERIRNFISNELACLRATDEKGTVRYNELTEAMAWLEKQGEQKPAWSEEDESRFKSCIKVLQTSDGYDTINTKWLKSIKDKYTWKPSDEQMKALSNITVTGGISYVEQELINLYNDLKKLKG